MGGQEAGAAELRLPVKEEVEGAAVGGMARPGAGVGLRPCLKQKCLIETGLGPHQGPECDLAAPALSLWFFPPWPGSSSH